MFLHRINSQRLIANLLVLVALPIAVASSRPLRRTICGPTRLRWGIWCGVHDWRIHGTLRRHQHGCV